MATILSEVENFNFNFNGIDIEEKVRLKFGLENNDDDPFFWDLTRPTERDDDDEDIEEKNPSVESKKSEPSTEKPILLIDLETSLTGPLQPTGFENKQEIIPNLLDISFPKIANSSLVANSISSGDEEEKCQNITKISEIFDVCSGSSRESLLPEKINQPNAIIPTSTATTTTDRNSISKQDEKYSSNVEKEEESSFCKNGIPMSTTVAVESSCCTVYNGKKVSDMVEIVTNHLENNERIDLDLTVTVPQPISEKFDNSPMVEIQQKIQTNAIIKNRRSNEIRRRSTVGGSSKKKNLSSISNGTTKRNPVVECIQASSSSSLVSRPCLESVKSETYGVIKTPKQSRLLPPTNYTKTNGSSSLKQQPSVPGSEKRLLAPSVLPSSLSSKIPSARKKNILITQSSIYKPKTPTRIPIAIAPKSSIKMGSEKSSNIVTTSSGRFFTSRLPTSTVKRSKLV